jgi:acetyltransferase-like isoleucine patch superfamily enzyme
VTSLGVVVHPTAVVAANVELGSGTVVGEYVVLGRAPRGKKDGELRLTIGPDSIIRPFTTIYAGTTIGARLQTGQGASIREDNVLGDDVSVGTHASLEFGNRVGSRVRIHTGCFLELVTLEDEVFVGPHVVFTDDPHPQCPAYLQCVKGAPRRPPRREQHDPARRRDRRGRAHRSRQRRPRAPHRAAYGVGGQSRGAAQGRHHRPRVLRRHLPARICLARGALS